SAGIPRRLVFRLESPIVLGFVTRGLGAGRPESSELLEPGLPEQSSDDRWRLSSGRRKARRRVVPERGQPVKQILLFFRLISPPTDVRCARKPMASFLRVFVVTRWGQTFQDIQTTRRSITQGLFVESGRRRSFLCDCTPSRPFVGLVCRTAGAQAT